MKKINNWEQISEAQEYPTLKAGGYVCVIRNVEDDAEKECLKVFYDIYEGEFKGHYQNLYRNMNFWGGVMFRSYKENAQSFFKGFITTIEKSNPTFRWDWDESKLKNKLIGIVLREEEYKANDGSIKTRFIADQIHSVDKIRKGEFKVKEKKLIQDKRNNQTVPTTTSEFDIAFDDLQF